MRDVDQRAKDPEADASPRDARSTAAKQAKRRGAAAAPRQDTAEASGGAVPWFSGAGLRRRISLYSDHGDQDATIAGGSTQRSAADAVRGASREGASLARVAGAAGVLAALLIVGVPLAMMSISGDQAAVLLQRGGGTSANEARHLQGLSAQHNRTATFTAPPEGPSGLSAAMAACAGRAGPLPPVVLPPVTAPASPSTVDGDADPLRALSMDCSAPGRAEACARVAASTNSYEGSAGTATKEHLADYLSSWEAYAAEAAATGRQVDPRAPSDLDVLALDCQSEPAACEAAAKASNSYEGGTAASDNAIAEAQAYLDSLEVSAVAAAAVAASQAAAQDDSAPLSSLALDCESDPAACAAASAGTNSYDRPESSLQRARAAEEAAPDLLGHASLAVDCWGPDGDGNVAPEVARECARSRAANDYEARPQQQGHHAHNHDHDHAVAEHLEIGPDGLPVGGETQGFYSWISDVEGANDAEVAAHAASYSAGARRAASMGYDAPAVEWDPVAAACEHQQAVANQLQEQRRLAEVEHQARPTDRAYFKNPCNDPTLRVYYKNADNSPEYQMGRVYYKNPANAPDFVQATQASVAPAVPSLPAAIVSFWQGQPQVLAAIVIGLLGTTTLALLQGGRPRRLKASATEPGTASESENLLAPAPAADLEARSEDSPRKVTAFSKSGIFAGSPSPRKAGAVPRLQVAEAGGVDVVRSGAVDSPRREGTPLFGRSVTPLGGRAAAGAGSAAEDAE